MSSHDMSKVLGELETEEVGYDGHPRFYDPFAPSTKVEKGPYLMTITSDKDGKPLTQWNGHDGGHVPRKHPDNMPSWMIGLREMDAQFRGRAVNDKTLTEIRQVVTNLVAAAAAVGDITADDHREVLSKLMVTPNLLDGVIQIDGVSLLGERYAQKQSGMLALRQGVEPRNNPWFMYQESGHMVYNSNGFNPEARKQSTESMMGPVPMAVGTVRENMGVREIWTGSAWEPEQKFLVVTEGFYMHGPSKRLAYMLGSGKRRNYSASANLAFMQWSDTNEMFYVPIEEFRAPGTWNRFEG